MEEEEDKANIQRHWWIERRIESRCFRRNSGNLEREKRKREREERERREREMPDTEPLLQCRERKYKQGFSILGSSCLV